MFIFILQLLKILGMNYNYVFENEGTKKFATCNFLYFHMIN